jgi:peptidyl-prolyl cis-trans isomerase SurA
MSVFVHSFTLNQLKRWFVVSCITIMFGSSPAWAQLGKPIAPTPADIAAQNNASNKTIGADKIAAVVNKDVITQLQVNERVAFMTSDLKNRGAPMPTATSLMQVALEQLIAERLVEQEAKRMKVEVKKSDVDSSIAEIARRNNLDVSQIRKQVESLGLAWDEFRAKIGRDILFDRMRSRMAETTMMISDAEIDAYLQEQTARKASGLEPPKPPPPPQPKPQPPPRAQPVQPLILGIAQIFIRVPEAASPSEVEALRKKMIQLRAQLSKESFDKVAIASSQGVEASQGGDMGVRPAKDWPALFEKTVVDLQPGQVSPIIKSPAGFHILKLMGRAGGPPPKPVQAPAPPPEPTAPANSAGPSGPMMVEQTKARHILIKTSTIVSDERAKQRIEEARQRLTQGGQNFADVAIRVSEDASAPSGGELGWLNPGETVPPFERAMNALAIGDISEPVQSQFGWHLIQVEERRTKDMADQYQRNVARQALFERRAAAAFEAWLQQVKNQSYIDDRMKRLNPDLQQ